MPIRPATEEDVELVAALRLAFLADHRGIEPYAFEPEFVEHTRRFVADRHHAGDLLTWIADDGGTGHAVGVVSLLLRPVPPRPDALGTVEGYVVNLHVSPHHRRRGIGQQLLDACLDHARTAALRRLVLHATDDGRPLYERAGFRRSDRWYELDLPRGSGPARRPDLAAPTPPAGRSRERRRRSAEG